MASGMKRSLEKSHISGLLEWMEESTSIQSSFIKKFLIYFLPSVAIISLILLITGVYGGRSY